MEQILLEPETLLCLYVIRCFSFFNIFLTSIFTCFRHLFQGLEYLIENELVKNNPEDIAEFLFKGEGLNKRAIGDYLGEKLVY